MKNQPEIKACRDDQCPKCKGTGVEDDSTTEEGIDDCPYCRGGGLISLAVEARARDFLTSPSLADPMYDFIVSLIYPEKRAALSPKWQGMDTAPRDGTRVLLWNKLWSQPLAGHLMCGEWAAYWCSDHTGHFKYQPTHWKPLDPPPAEGD